MLCIPESCKDGKHDTEALWLPMPSKHMLIWHNSSLREKLLHICCIFTAFAAQNKTFYASNWLIFLAKMLNKMTLEHCNHDWRQKSAIITRQEARNAASYSPSFLPEHLHWCTEVYVDDCLHSSNSIIASLMHMPAVHLSPLHILSSCKIKPVYARVFSRAQTLELPPVKAASPRWQAGEPIKVITRRQEPLQGGGRDKLI